MWYIIIPTLGLIIVIRVIRTSTYRRIQRENRRIKERGYIDLLDQVQKKSEPQPTPDQRLRQKYSMVKRREQELAHKERLISYERKEVELDKQSNQFTLREIEHYRVKFLFEIEQKKTEVEGILKEIQWSKRDLDLSTREQNLFISERKFDFLQIAFKESIKLQKSALELEKKEFGIHQAKAMQMLREQGLLIRGKMLSVEAKAMGLVLKDGILEVRRREDKLTNREQSLRHQKDRYRNEMQRKENDLFLSFGRLKNERSAFAVESRAMKLQEEWDAIIETNRNHVEYLREQKNDLYATIRKLHATKKQLGGR